MTIYLFTYMFLKLHTQEVLWCITNKSFLCAVHESEILQRDNTDKCLVRYTLKFQVF